MRIGCCCNIEDGAIAKDAGFDFIECKVVSLLPDETSDAAAAAFAQHTSAPLAVAAFNVFLPRDLKVVGPEIDHARLEHYLENALTRVQKIGGEIIVFGSGASRAVPDGFPLDEAQHQLVDFLRGVATKAERTGVTVVIEPLNRKESNIINSVAEGVDLARAVDRPNIQVLADFYHMDEEQEPLAHLAEYKDWIKHIHVADTGRLAPGTGQYPYSEFVEYLHQSGYDGMVSIECRWLDFKAEAGASLQFMRRTFTAR